MADLIYSIGADGFFLGQIAWERDDIQAILIDPDEYRPDVDGDETLSDIPAAAVLKTTLLTGRRVVNRWCRADSVIFGKVKGESAGAVVLMKVFEGSQELPVLIAYIENIEGFPMKPNGGDVQVSWSPDGIFSMQRPDFNRMD